MKQLCRRKKLSESLRKLRESVKTSREKDMLKEADRER